MKNVSRTYRLISCKPCARYSIYSCPIPSFVFLFIDLCFEVITFISVRTAIAKHRTRAGNLHSFTQVTADYLSEQAIFCVETD